MQLKNPKNSKCKMWPTYNRWAFYLFIQSSLSNILFIK